MTRFLQAAFANSYFVVIECQPVPVSIALIKGLIESENVLELANKVTSLCGPMYCLLADLGAFTRRSAVRTRWYSKRAAKRLLPEFVLTKIRQARQRALANKHAAEVSRLRADPVAKWCSEVH